MVEVARSPTKSSSLAPRSLGMVDMIGGTGGTGRDGEEDRDGLEEEDEDEEDDGSDGSGGLKSRAGDWGSGDGLSWTGSEAGEEGAGL